MADWPSDKELEEIYRKGSEGHDFQYNEDAWNDMERLLDKRKRRRFFFFMFSVIALGSLTYLMSPLFTSDINKNQNLAETSIESIATTSTIKSVTNATSPKSLITKESTSDNTISSSSQANKNLKKQVIPTQLTTSENNKADGRVSNQKRTNRVTSAGTNTDNLKNSENQTTPDFNFETGRGNGSINNSSSANNNNSIPTNTLVNFAGLKTAEGVNISENSEQLEIRKVTSELNMGLGLLNKIPVIAFPVSLNWSGDSPEFTALTPDKKISSNSFLIGATIGAESSWSPQGEFSSIDMNIGLRGSYYIGNKLGIGIGASYINDIFEAPGMDYNPKQEFWKASGAPGSPMMAHAESSMIELSTGITYAFGGIDNNGISLGANLISNFMLKESYEYLYPNENHNFNSSWTMANSTWLNALDLNASYRIRLSNNWLLESGPYFKVPIEGIGHGNIKLTSFGIRFSLGFSK